MRRVPTVLPPWSSSGEIKCRPHRKPSKKLSLCRVSCGKSGELFGVRIINKLRIWKQNYNPNSNIPRFIQNKPCGIDKFDGGSQERLAKTIARHFCQNDSLDEECTLPRIIGIEGIWGSGKSNVVKMLERELSDDYYFLSMTHGDIKRTCNAALYWNCLQANLLMMVSYLEMQQ